MVRGESTAGRLARISRAAADQRAGRAGRTGPGTCIRLWSERDHRGRPEFEQPEIHRVDLSSAVLALHAWGVRDPVQFDWFDAPKPERLAEAERLLRLLGAVDGDPPRITPLGEAMLALPVHPRLARLLVAARDCDRAREGAAIAALLSEKDIRLERHSASHRSAVRGPTARPTAESDILDRLDLLAEAEAARFAPSLRSRGIDPAAARQVGSAARRPARTRFPVASTCGDIDRSATPTTTCSSAILLAYPDRVVKRRGSPGTGVMVGGRGVCLAPESVVRDADLFVAIDAREDRRAGVLEAQVSLASIVRLEWLEELFPAHVRRRARDSLRRIAAAGRQHEPALVSRPASSRRRDRRAPSPSIAGSHLAEALRAAGRRASSGTIQRRPSGFRRVDFLRRAAAGVELARLQRRGPCRVARDRLPGKIAARRSRADRSRSVPAKPAHARSRTANCKRARLRSLSLPSGRQARLAYEPGARRSWPCVFKSCSAGPKPRGWPAGACPCLLHLLGPNNRPVQITDDLKSFWTTTYHQVRKDLRRRYPKHAWPEDPLRGRPPKPPKRPKIVVKPESPAARSTAEICASQPATAHSCSFP